MKLILTGLIVLLSAQMASAQTAEETVAYIMFHVEADMPLIKQLNDKNETVKQANKALANYTFSAVSNGKTLADIVLDVKRETECVYFAEQRFLESGKITDRQKKRVDFGKPIDTSAVSNSGMNAILLKSSDQCAFKVTDIVHGGRSSEDQCRDRDQFSILPGDIDRVNRAMAYLRTNFCKGKAF